MMMVEIEYNSERFPARKDLLHFVEEHEGERIYEEIGKNPKAWIDELNIVSHLLTKNPVVGGMGLDLVPKDEPDVREIGPGVLLYRGDNRMQRGLWVKEENGYYEEEDRNWSHYRLSSSTVASVNKKFNMIKPKDLLPEHFEPISRKPDGGKEQGKRPVMVFDKGGMTVYAKGADTVISYFTASGAPGYRLTRIAGVSKTSSKRELEMTKDFMNLGIRVPEIVGMNESEIEPFLFLREVEGESPEKYITTHRERIIDQDAEMLAKMCLGGYRKQGFCDFDDKIYDGEHLHLIDVDECRDLYWINATNFRNVLLDPSGGERYHKFRETQKDMFISSMKDAIFGYQKSLTQDKQSQERYVRSFFGTLGWEKPVGKNLDEMLNFSENYMTLDSYISAMSDTD